MSLTRPLIVRLGCRSEVHQLQQSLQAAGALVVEHVLELETVEGSEDAAGKPFVEDVARDTSLRL